MRGLIIAIGLVAILAILAFLFVNNANNEADNSTEEQTTSETTDIPNTTQSETNQPNTDTGADQGQSSVTINYTDSGFSPNRVTIASGGTVMVVNASDRMIQFHSDPHPSHTENSELNLGSVSAGESKSFTVTRTGTWGYHDHIDSSETGTIVVQ